MEDAFLARFGQALAGAGLVVRRELLEGPVGDVVVTLAVVERYSATVFVSPVKWKSVGKALARQVNTLPAGKFRLRLPGPSKAGH
ncbi:MAG: hypothetical protein U1E95_01780 [Rubrivivax sp.]